MTTDRIEIDPKIMMGKPVIRGTRITVELILRKLAEGATETDLLDAYPRLRREDLQAAMRYAADTLAHEEIVVPSAWSTSALNFLADESCDFNVVRALRDQGHDVLAICEFAKRMEDSEVIDLSSREDRILITEDKDFGQLVYAHGHGSRGLILIRYPAMARARLGVEAVSLIEQKQSALPGSFVVLEPGRVRIRRLPLSTDHWLVTP
jgi:uncharacterized protein (DUF433 family)/predicted nuclease of predicted toxin-antitoxin system